MGTRDSDLRPGDVAIVVSKTVDPVAHIATVTVKVTRRQDSATATATVDFGPTSTFALRVAAGKLAEPGRDGWMQERLARYRTQVEERARQKAQILAVGELNAKETTVATPRVR